MTTRSISRLGNGATAPLDGERGTAMTPMNAPRIPTLPFGTKRAVHTPPPIAEAPRAAGEFAPFRFVMNQEQIASLLRWPNKSSGPAVAPVDSAEGSRPSRWLLLACVALLAMFAVMLLVWSGTPSSPEEAAVPRGAAPAERRLPHSLPQKAVLAQAMIPTAIPEPAQSITPSRAPNATPHAEPPTSVRLSAPKARATLKRQSVLASVLAPPPAD